MNAPSPTLALLRKDRPWLLGFLVVGYGLSAGVFLEYGFVQVFVVAEDEVGQALELLLAPLAVLLGLCATLGDDFQSTRDFVRHRPLTPRRVFWTRTSAASAVIGAWMALGTGHSWLREMLFGLGGASADTSRFGALLAMTLGLTLDYAVVAFAFALPARWLHRVWFAALLLFVRYAAQSLLGPESPSGLACALLFAGATGALLLAAERCERAGHDPDRATPGGALAAATGVTLVAASFLGAIAVSGWQTLTLEALARVRPNVGEVGAGELGFLAAPDREGLCQVLAADGAPTGRQIPAGDWVFAAPRPVAPGFDPFRVGALYPPYAWYQSQPGARERRRVQILEDALRVVEERSSSRRSWILPLPEGSTRSNGAQLVELKENEEEPLFYVSPELGRIWLVTVETPPRLVEQPLPDSDAPRSTVWRRNEAGEHHLAIAGAAHSWLYSGGKWKRDDEATSEREALFSVLDDDPLRPEVELQIAGAPILRHRYGLGRVSEKILAASAAAGSILRPAPFALLGACTDYAAVSARESDRALLVLDPLLGGGYTSLLAPNLALTALLMLMTLRSLRRRGASARRTSCWVLAVVCAGVFTVPLLLALEPRRAWRRPARSAPPAVIISAA